MRQIKIILISLYVIILGFIVFGNASVFGADAESVYITPVEETTNFTDYFINMQDRFDYSLLTSNRQGFVQAKNFLQDAVINRNYGYFVEAVLNTGYGSGNEARGYIVNVFFISQTENLLTLDKHFDYITFTDYQLNSQVDFYYPCCQVQSWYKFVVYNYGNNYQLVNNGSYENCLLPFCCLNYTHPIFLDSIISNTSNGQIANAINNQTNTIVNETQKQTNQISGTVTNSTREQTNALLDTNDTGNETMSVNDTTTDTSADLGGLFNQISSSFTDTTSETQKRF